MILTDIFKIISVIIKTRPLWYHFGAGIARKWMIFN